MYGVSLNLIETVVTITLSSSRIQKSGELAKQWGILYGRILYDDTSVGRGSVYGRDSCPSMFFFNFQFKICIMRDQVGFYFPEKLNNKAEESKFSP